MDKKEMKVESTEDIAKYWSDFSAGYSKMIAPSFEGIGLTLFNLVGGRHADTILEVGCGEGTMAINFALSKKEGSKLVSSDIAENMCKITASRLDRLASRIAQGKLMGIKQAVFQEEGDLSQVQWDGKAGRTWETLGVELRQADNENLAPVFPQPNVVDCLIASLSLHIVNNPHKMLAEAFRVLKPGKIGVFTVWGSRELSQQFTINELAEKKFGKPSDQPKERSLFHLNDRKATIKLVEEAGFTDVLGWEEMTPFFSMAPAFAENMIKGFASNLKKAGSDASEEEIADFVRAERERIIKEDKFPIGLSILIVRGTKPL